MEYPGHVVKAGEPDPRIVKALKTALNRALALQRVPELKLDPGQPSFGQKMTQTVKLFQARHADGHGRPLKIDGVVGSITWAALFGASTVASVPPPADPLVAATLRAAADEELKAVREVPRNSNRGPEVDQYLKRVGVPTGLAWCCAFTYWCFDEAARAAARPNPMVRTAGCLNHWNRAAAAGARRVTAAQAVDNPALVQPGMVFIMDFGGGAGHTGFVEAVDGGQLTTIEGNTDASKTREGGGVYRLSRKVADINKGFIDYAASAPVAALVRARRAAAPATRTRAVKPVAKVAKAVKTPKTAKTDKAAKAAKAPQAAKAAPAPKPVTTARRRRRKPAAAG